MAGSLSPCGSIGDINQDAELDDGYIYDDYDVSPLLSDQLLESTFRKHRSFDGRTYSLLSTNSRDRVEQNTIVPNRNKRKCLYRVFVILSLCGIGFLAGFFSSKKYFHSCKNTLFTEKKLDDFHAVALSGVSASNIEKFSR